MEDNILNERVESNIVESLKKSGSRRTVSKTQSTKIVKNISKVRHIKSEKHGAIKSRSEVVMSTEGDLPKVPSYPEKRDEYEAVTLKNNVNSLSQSLEISSTDSNHVEKSSVEYSTDSPGQTSAYLIYKKAGDWWNVFPKTDYTYSKSSKHRKEIAPGVWAMPNMSRPSLRPAGATPPAALAASAAALGARRSLEGQLEQSWTYRCAHDQQSASKSVNSNYLVNSSNTVNTSTTVESSNMITWISSAIWRVITYTLSTITSVFTRTHLFSFESSVSDAYYKPKSNSMLNKLELWYYKSACSMLFLDAWILSLFHHSQSHSAASSVVSAHAALARRRRMYLLFLLLPLILAALLSCCGSSAPSPAVASYTTWVSTLPSLWQSAISSLIPAWGGGNRSWSWSFAGNGDEVVLHSEAEPMPQPNLGEIQFLPNGDLDALVKRLLASAEFQSLVAQKLETVSDAEAEAKRSLNLLAAIEAEQQRLKDELSLKGDLENEHEKRLVEHQHAHDRLVLENSIMKGHIEELEGQMKMLLARLAAGGSGGGGWYAGMGRCCRVPVRIGGEGGGTGSGDSDARRLLLAVEAALAGKTPSGDLDGNGEEKTTTEEEEALVQKLRVLVSAHDNLEARLAFLSKNLTEALRQASKVSEETIMAAISSRVQEEFLKKEAALGASGESAGRLGTFVGSDVNIGGGCCNCTLTIDQIKKIVNDTISLYDADKTGLVDYALESGGGTVINIRCTENYNDRSLALAFLGLTFPWSSNHPRIALQPGVHPGECWAFRGAQGWLVVRLSRRIRVGAVSIEHIPASISSTGNIDAAPKDFSLWGLQNEGDLDPVLLGKFSYSNTGPSLQFFPVQNENSPPYQIVELAIESNHGNLEYTCLYRFRVHGTPA